MVNAEIETMQDASERNRNAARALQLDSADNVATMLSSVTAGSRVAVEGEGESVVVLAVDDLAAGHKIAVADLPSGAEIRKYGGEVIGIASQDIRCGEHVHEHNVRAIQAGASS